MNKPFSASKSAFLVTFLFVLTSVFSPVLGADKTGGEQEPFNASEVILHHVKDDHQWHIADWLVVPLPIIVYSEEKGLDMFSSSRFYDEHHNEVEYNGYKSSYYYLMPNVYNPRDFICRTYIFKPSHLDETTISIDRYID